MTQEALLARPGGGGCHFHHSPLGGAQSCWKGGWAEGLAKGPGERGSRLGDHLANVCHSPLTIHYLVLTDEVGSTSLNV